MNCQYISLTNPFLVCNLFAASAGLLCAQVKIDDPRGEALVDPAAKVEKLAGELKFIEGPVWIPNRKELIFSDIPNSVLMKWSKTGGLKEYAKREAPNGNTLDADGNLVTCQHAGRNLVREEKDGSTSVVVASFEGKKFNSPNDLIFRSDGTVWFTDPPYGLPKDAAKEQEGNFVFRFDPANKQTTIVSREFNMPNGLAFSPDEKRLYIADSGAPGRVGAFPVMDDGSLGPAIWWTDGGADGIRTDALGNLYTAAADGVRIYSVEGKMLATIAVPEQPANLTFGGEDGKWLFITARTSLYAVAVKVAGAKLKVP